jgi:hypothetical protein
VTRLAATINIFCKVTELDMIGAMFYGLVCPFLPYRNTGTSMEQIIIHTYDTRIGCECPLALNKIQLYATINQLLQAAANCLLTENELKATASVKAN